MAVNLETRRFAGLTGDLTGTNDFRPPLVLLHGLTFDRTTWGPSLDEFRNIDPDRVVLNLDLPGHGDSADVQVDDLQTAVELVGDAVDAAGLQHPVIVGHSVGGMAAVIYGARRPSSGVVDVDQPLQVGDFARLVHDLAPQLRSQRFAELWRTFAESMHAELLPPAGQALVRATSNPRQEVVLAYWAEVLVQTPEELAALLDVTVQSLRAANVPFTMIAGAEPGPEYRSWLATTLPHATISVWPGTGHFPHIAHPQAFARVLAETATWPTSSVLQTPADR